MFDIDRIDCAFHYASRIVLALILAFPDHHHRLFRIWLGDYPGKIHLALWQVSAVFGHEVQRSGIHSVTETTEINLELLQRHNNRNRPLRISLRAEHAGAAIVPCSVDELARRIELTAAHLADKPLFE